MLEKTFLIFWIFSANALDDQLMTLPIPKPLPSRSTLRVSKALFELSRVCPGSSEICSLNMHAQTTVGW